jgi:hypothetical protein
MIMLRCGHTLLRRIKAPIEDGSPSGSNLGDWHARAVFTKPKHLVLCTNERSLLSVVIPLAPSSDLIERFRLAAVNRIRQIPAPSEILEKECSAFDEVHIGKTTNRSVISTMNQQVYRIQSYLAYPHPDDLEHLGFTLCDTPMSSISTHWPWLEAELILTGSVTPGRKWKVPAEF